MKIFFIFVILGTCFYSCARFDTWYEVAYVVTGSFNDINISYKNNEGETEQLDNFRTSWSYTFGARKGFVARCSVQNNLETGIISLELYKEGKLLNSAFADTAFAQISVEGTI